MWAIAFVVCGVLLAAVIGLLLRVDELEARLAAAEIMIRRLSGVDNGVSRTPGYGLDTTVD